jgi:cyanophycinase
MICISIAVLSIYMRRKRPRGKLLAIGGNEHSSLDGENYVQRKNPYFIPDEIFQRFIDELKENSNSRIGIITTTAGEPRRTAESFKEVFHELNCHRIEILDIRTEYEANNEENLRLLEKLDGVIFSGGDQTRIERTLLQTKFNDLLYEKYMNENFIIAGTSSGAMAMADHMICRGSAMEGFIKGEVELGTGLSFIRNVVIDTHFDARGRFHRLVQAACKEKVLGIGIAEDTAALISYEDTVRVIGSGVVTIVETDKISDTNIDDVAEGAPFAVNNLIVHILSRRHVYRMQNVFEDDTPEQNEVLEAKNNDI